MSSNFTDNQISAGTTQSCVATDLHQNAFEAGEVTFKISPIVRLTLNSFYGCLVLPLPFLAHQTQAPINPVFLTLGLGFGWLILLAPLSEQVRVDEEGICISYSNWVPRFLRKKWSLSWKDVVALKPRSTGQGGIVYYLLSKSGNAYLLPMRVAGFAQLVRYVEQLTDIDTKDIRPLAQPWMYFILFALTLLLWFVDILAVFHVVKA